VGEAERAAAGASPPRALAVKPALGLVVGVGAAERTAARTSPPPMLAARVVT